MVNLKFALRYLLHWWKANDRHGLHSPFVYRLVDEVIYDFSDKKVYADLQNGMRQSHKISRTDKLLYRLVNTLHPQTVLLLGEHASSGITILQKAAHQARYTTAGTDAKADLIYIQVQPPAQLLPYFDQAVSHAGTRSCIIINHIYQYPSAWQAIQAHPEVTVTINLFWFGLVFFRKGQMREDFRIRF